MAYKKKDAEKVIAGYKVDVTFAKNQTKIEDTLNKKCRFILATNKLDNEQYKDDQILKEYKEQQNVESGFRFLKDPWFMVDSIFLKLPKRIEALMMVMTRAFSFTHTIREVVTNLNRIRRKIIALFGKTAAWIYGIFYENWVEGLGM
jgi:transposase